MWEKSTENKQDVLEQYLVAGAVCFSLVTVTVTMEIGGFMYVGLM